MRRWSPPGKAVMEGLISFARCRFTRLVVAMQLVLGVLVICISMASLHRFYATHALLPGGHLDDPAARCTTTGGMAGFDVRALADRVDEVLVQLAELQDKLETTALKIGKKTKKRKHQPQPQPQQENMTMAEFRRFLEDEVIHPLYAAHIALRLIRIPRPDPNPDGENAGAIDPLVNFFSAEETRKYVTSKRTSRREGEANRTYGVIGHACVAMRRDLDEYMSYDVGAACPDDWDLGQRLMLGGCDPLPRRRCLARASKLFNRTLIRPINSSLWTLPDDANVRWSRYHCRGYGCLSARNPRRGYHRCVGCFDMDREKQRWMGGSGNGSTSSLVDFRIDEVLAVKKSAGEIRVGLDVTVGTGSFAARMRERGVTVVTTALNLGAPFAETVALRGLVALYTDTLGHRLPLFDNSMDLIHTDGVLDGWIDLQLLDFVLFDWDRVLRPGGLLWVDRFPCARKDLDDYMYMFLQFRYKKHRWVVSFKSRDEVYLSALLEKPPRS